MDAPPARPAVRRSHTWDNLAGLKARLGRPGTSTPVTPPLPHVTDPRASLHVPGRKVHNVDTTSAIITVRVGGSATEFHVHRSTLIQSSVFLRIKCKPEWLREAPVIELPDHVPEAFAVYSTWLYTDMIDSAPVASDPLHNAQHRAEWIDLANCYVLGEALIDTSFKDTVMDAIRAKVLGEAGDTIWEAAVDFVHIIYAGTWENASARRFVVDLYHYHAQPRHIETGKDDLPREFLYDLVWAHSADTYKPAVYGFSGIRTAQCSYHCHGAAECYVDGRS